MSVKRQASDLILVVSLLFAPSVALSQDPSGRQQMPVAKTIGRVAPTGPVPSLAVLNAAGAKLEGTKLTLTGVSPAEPSCSGGHG